MEYLLQLYVFMIVVDLVEGYVLVQGCVGVMLVIQGYIVQKVSLCL